MRPILEELAARLPANIRLLANRSAEDLLGKPGPKAIHVLPNAPVPPADRGSYNHLLYEIGRRRQNDDLVVSMFDPESWRVARGSDAALVQIAGRRHYLTDSLVHAVLARVPGLSPIRRHDLRLGRSAFLLARQVLRPSFAGLLCLWGDLRWAHLLRRLAPGSWLVFAQRHHRADPHHRDHYRVVDEVVFLTEKARREAVAAGMVRDDGSLSIRNGIDLSLHFPASPEQRRQARDELGIDPEALVFLMPSTLSHRKGVFPVIRWFKAAVARLPAAHPVLVLPGRFHPSLSPADLERLKREIADPSILALGGVPPTRMPTFFAAADICLHPSVDEGFGLAIVEAMASGLPVVAVDSGAVSEILEDGVDGILLSDRTADPQAVSALLRLAEDPSLRRRLGRAAVRSALPFSRAGAVDLWCDYLQSRLGRGPAHEGEDGAIHRPIADQLPMASA